MKFGSVCSGIEAASVAFNPLGWDAAWFAEIEPFPSAVLAHHYPDVQNVGDMTKIVELLHTFQIDAPDMLCGGTPCQAFSVAGLRNSLDDARGNLSLTFCEIANAIDTTRLLWGEQPAIIFWENVPGVLSTKDNAFGCFLAGLAGEDDALVAPGGKWTDAGYVHGPQRTVAWRVLDAQYFGLAQRRRRVFVVASAREGFAPAEVLFEFDGLRRDSAPSRQAGQRPTGTLSARTEGGGGLGTDFELGGGLVPTPHAAISPALKARDHKGVSSDGDGDGAILVPMLAHSLRGEGFDASEDGTGRGTPLVPVAYRTAGDGAVFEEGDRTAPLTTGTDPCANILAFDTTQVTSVANRSNPKVGDPCHPLAAGAHAPAVAYGLDQELNGRLELAGTLQRKGEGGFEGTVAYTTKLHNTQSNQAGKIYEEYTVGLDRNSPPPALLTAMQVRRLTPMECERLQGFPDGYTDVPHRNKPAADGPRYKALGNSWAVPVVRWIGERIKAAL